MKHTRVFWSHWATELCVAKSGSSPRRPRETVAWHCESEGQFSVETPGCWRWDIETLLRKTGLRERLHVLKMVGLDRRSYQSVLKSRRFCHESWMPDMELQDLMFFLMGFGLALVWSFFVMTPLLLWRWRYLFCTIVTYGGNVLFSSKWWLPWVSEKTSNLGAFEQY